MTQTESGAYLRNPFRVPRRRPFMYLNSHTPSGQSRVDRVTQLRTDGVHCRESAGTGPVNLHIHILTYIYTYTYPHIDIHAHTHSRCWTFRRTHTSADPIRVLCTRLALPLTLSLTSRLAPRVRLTFDVPTRAFWLAGIFLRRKKRCAGVVGTRTDWVLKGEEGGMTTPLL